MAATFDLQFDCRSKAAAPTDGIVSDERVGNIAQTLVGAKGGLLIDGIPFHLRSVGVSMAGMGESRIRRHSLRIFPGGVPK